MSLYTKIKNRIRKEWKRLWNTVIPFLSRQVVYYNQNSLRYLFVKYGREQISSVGCGPFACAIVISSLLKKRVTPQEIARWSVKHGFYEYRHGSYHKMIPAVMAAYGLSCVDLKTDTKRMQQCLQQGGLAIVLCRPGTFSKGGHFVAVGWDTVKKALRVYDSGNVLHCYKKYNEEIIKDALLKSNPTDGPVWYISEYRADGEKI